MARQPDRLWEQLRERYVSHTADHEAPDCFQEAATECWEVLVGEAHNPDKIAAIVAKRYQWRKLDSYRPRGGSLARHVPFDEDLEIPSNPSTSYASFLAQLMPIVELIPLLSPSGQCLILQRLQGRTDLEIAENESVGRRQINKRRNELKRKILGAKDGRVHLDGYKKETESDFRYWHNRAAILKAVCGPEEAYPSFKRSVELSTGREPIPVFSLAELLTDQGRYLEAIDLLSAALNENEVKWMRHYPKSLGCRRVLGRSFLAIGQPENALVQFREASRRAPRDPVSWWGVIAATRKIDKTKAAEAMFRYYEDDTHFVPTYAADSLYSYILADLERFDEALVFALRAIQGAPTPWSRRWRSGEYLDLLRAVVGGDSPANAQDLVRSIVAGTPPMPFENIRKARSIAASAPSRPRLANWRSYFGFASPSP